MAVEVSGRDVVCAGSQFVEGVEESHHVLARVNIEPHPLAPGPEPLDVAHAFDRHARAAPDRGDEVQRQRSGVEAQLAELRGDPDAATVLRSFHHPPIVTLKKVTKE